MEEKVRSLYERYVDACAMCSKLDCETCTLKEVIEDLTEILEYNKATK